MPQNPTLPDKMSINKAVFTQIPQLKKRNSNFLPNASVLRCNEKTFLLLINAIAVFNNKQGSSNRISTKANGRSIKGPR